MNPSEPAALAYPTLQTVAADLAAGRATAQTLTEAALARASDPAGEGARVFLHVDAARARAAALASDTLRRAGTVRSPLEGIPVSVKDLFDMAGQTTRAGSVVLDEAPPATRNAAVIDRLQALGAIVIGRTNMTEFAYSGLGLNPHYGTPRNPWGRMADGGGRIPGGSSSGAAVSVTDGMAVVAIGSDTGGSVRIPAALCGLTGFKPTARRVSTAGVLPLSSSLDSIGPLAASVRCCAIVDAAICAGHAPAMPQPRDLRSVRLLVPTTIVQDDMDDSVAAAFERACHVLEQAGATLTRAAMPELKQLADSNATRGTLAAAEAWAWHRALIEKDGHRYDPRVIARLRAGQAMSAADYIDLLRFRARWQASVAARLTGFDALLMPTTPIIAPGIAATAASDQAYSKANGLMLRNCAAINFLDGCALSLPCHKPGQAPVGLMLAGLPMHDAALIDIGLAAQAALH